MPRPKPCTSAAAGNSRAPHWHATTSRAGICWTIPRAWPSAPSTPSARAWCAACLGCRSWAACPRSRMMRAPTTRRRRAPPWTLPTTTRPCASSSSIWTWTCRPPRRPSPTCWVNVTSGCHCCATAPTARAWKPCWPRPSAKTWTRSARPCPMAGPKRYAARRGWLPPICRMERPKTSCWPCWTGQKSRRLTPKRWSSGKPWRICC